MSYEVTNDEIVYALSQGFIPNKPENQRLSRIEVIIGQDFLFEDLTVVGETTISVNHPERKFKFKNVTFKNKVSVRGEFRNDVIFENCVFEEALMFENSDFARTLLLKSCTITKEIYLKIGNIHNLTFSECKVLGSLSFQGYTISDLKFDSKSELEFLEFKSGRISRLNIERTKINRVNIDGGEFLDTTNIEASELSIMFLKGGEFKKGIAFSNTKVTKFIVFELPEINHVTFKHLNGEGHIFFLSKKFINFDILNSNFGAFTIDTTVQKDSFVNFKGSRVVNIEIKNTKNLGYILFSDILIPQGGSLKLLSSDLGKADFIRCYFESASFEFENSKVSEIFLAETDFPKTVFVNGKKNYPQAQLAFGQLQTAYQKQGDSVRANEYHAREVEAHFKTIRWDRKIFIKRIKWSIPWFSKMVFTKINLFLNRLSNNFGRDWFRSVVFSIVSGLLIFYIMILSTDEYYFAFRPTLNLEFFEAFLKFMNPLRHFETEKLFEYNSPNVTLSKCSYLVDFLGRVIITYGYYQTIQAFRKFGKK